MKTSTRNYLIVGACILAALLVCIAAVLMFAKNSNVQFSPLSNDKEVVSEVIGNDEFGNPIRVPAGQDADAVNETLSILNVNMEENKAKQSVNAQASVANNETSITKNESKANYREGEITPGAPNNRATSLAANLDSEADECGYWGYDLDSHTLTISDTAGVGVTQPLDASSPGWLDGGEVQYGIVNVVINAPISPSTTQGWFGATKTVQDGKVRLPNIQSFTGLNYLDLSNAKAAQCMFAGCDITSFDALPSNMSGVEEAQGMFARTSITNAQHQAALDALTNATDLSYLFSNNTKLTSLDVSAVNVSKVAHFDDMFYNCKNLITISCTASTDWSSSFTGTSYNMFYKCTSLVGENNTVYSSEHTDITYARIGTNDAPGYFSVALQPDPESNLNYQVCIWGFDEDTIDSDPTHTADLTFGPAIGYNKSSLDRDGHKNASHSGKHCIHEDSWAEIVQHCKDGDAIDVYSACLENWCTKSVPLNLNPTIGEMPTNHTKCSVLDSAINDAYKKFNDHYDSSYCESSNYATSRIRATLNGYDGSTTSFSPSIYAYPSGQTNDCLTSSNCLLSCFPDVLQNNIKPKYMQVPTEWITSQPQTITTSPTLISDKLWLMNSNENFGLINTRYNDYRNQYTKAKNMFITASKNYYNMAFNESGSVVSRWLRSPVRHKTNSAARVLDTGNFGNDVVTWKYGISPCFCLGDTVSEPEWEPMQAEIATGDMIDFYPAFDDPDEVAGYKFAVYNGSEYTEITASDPDAGLTMADIYAALQPESGIPTSTLYYWKIAPNAYPLKCYTVKDLTWNYVFGASACPSGGEADVFHDKFHDEYQLDSRSQNNGITSPLIDSNFGSNWNKGSGSSDIPQLANGVAYVESAGVEPSGGFYCSYGGNNGDILSNKSNLVWGSLADSSDNLAYYRDLSEDKWNSMERINEAGVVLAREFPYDASQAKVNLKSISLDTTDVLKNYNAGDCFDPSGLVVTATYTDDSTAIVDINDCEFNPDTNTQLTPDVEQITVSYTSGGVIREATITIDVAGTYTVTVSAGAGSLKSGTIVPKGWTDGEGSTETWKKDFDKGTSYEDIIEEWDGIEFVSNSEALGYEFFGFNYISGTLKSDTVFVAGYSNLFYQVCIWGFGQDTVGVEGNTETAAITFGPATGQNSDCLDVDGHTSHEDGKRCIHEDSWEEIIYRCNNGTADVYSDCLEAGCTKSVPLYLNSLIGNMPNSKTTCSALCSTVKDAYKKWNDTCLSTDCDSANWATSRIRATLIGFNNMGSFIPSSYAGTCLHSSSCLLSCFPSYLATAIMPKYYQVPTSWSDESPYSIAEGSIATVSDKLWFPSAEEIYGQSGIESYLNFKEFERPQYSKKSIEDTAWDSGSDNKVYNEDTAGNSCWTRSPNRDYLNNAACIGSDGTFDTSEVTAMSGISPFFCIGIQPTPYYTVTVDIGEGLLKEGQSAPDGWTPGNGTTWTKDFAVDTSYEDILAEWADIELEHSINSENYTFGGFAPSRGTLTSNTTFFAEWMTTYLYKVCIWDIGQDTYDSDPTHTVGLTFGPAIGSSITCLDHDGGHEHCIHNDSWETIIANCRAGHAEWYRDCLQEGCTKAVPINLNSTIGTMPKETTSFSIFNTSIHGDYHVWNYIFNEDDSKCECECANYATSRIRATLNGTTGSESRYAGIYCLDSSNCLLSCFPKVLQDNIQAKFMNVATSWETTSPYTILQSTSIADKLWLMSINESYTNADNAYNDYRNQYFKAYAMSIDWQSPGNNKTYDEQGYCNYFMLRTPCRAYKSYIGVVPRNGQRPYADRVLDNFNGFAPCFCL